MDVVFDQRAGTLVYVARTTVFALALTNLLGAVVYACGGQASGAEAEMSIAMIPVVTVVLAPVLENLCLVGFINFLLSFSSNHWKTVVIVATVAGLLHWGAGNSIRAITGAVLFAIMTVTYLTSVDRGTGRRYLVTVAQHMLFNAPATLVLVWGLAD